MPVISIIVPVYNVEKYIDKCICSILRQSFTDFELILVDDGSTDLSGSICDKYAKKDNRIKVIHKDNGGVSTARNAGIECGLMFQISIYHFFINLQRKIFLEKMGGESVEKYWFH